MFLKFSDSVAIATKKAGIDDQNDRNTISVASADIEASATPDAPKPAMLHHMACDRVRSRGRPKNAPSAFGPCRV